MCSITQELMVDPVMAEDGHTYERTAIMNWLKDHTTSPLDPSVTIKDLRINRSVLVTIEELIESGNLDEETKEVWMEKKKVLNLEKAQKMFRNGNILDAAKLGLPKAMGIMAYRYFFGEDGGELNNEKAFEFATKAAYEGDGFGMHILGLCYQYGKSVDEDSILALQWHEKSAAKGESSASYHSGRLYANGYGCEIDAAKAVSYFKQGSDHKHNYATNELGICYYEGFGVPKDLKKAKTLSSRSVIQSPVK
jgi:TPR repeat protein